MKSLLSMLAVLSLVLSTGALADNRERGHSDDRGRKVEHSKDKDHKTFTVDKTEGNGPLVVTFDGSRLESAKKFYWSFGNNETLTTTNSIVTYVYKTAGTFTASLKYAVNASNKELKNLKDGGSVIIKVLNIPPVASINCTTNNLLVSCNSLSSYDPEGLPLSYSFDFGDGFIDSNPSGLSSHAYALAGLYTVNLTVTDAGGLTSSVSTQVQPVRPPNVPPQLSLNCSSTKANTVDCNSEGSIDSDGTIISYQYIFDDGVIETVASAGNISHSFSTGGSHSVTLKGVDNDGGLSIAQKNMAVKENTLPIANFNCLSEKPFQVTCQSISTDADAPNDSFKVYSWNIDSQLITGSDSSLNYSFQSGGDFPITLTVVDSYGGTGTVTKTIAVKNNIEPIASFNCSNTGIQNVHCTSTSTDSDGVIASATWILDDGTTLTGTSIDHFFSSGGNHLIKLVATDELGGNGSVENSFLTISNQLPIAEIYASDLSGVFPLSVSFEARNVSDADGTIANINWKFSDGTTAVGANVSHTFASVGNFTATLNVTDNLGGVTSKSLDINALVPLKAAPVVGFKYFENGTTIIELRSTITKTQFDIDHAFYTIDGSQTVPVTEFYSGTRTLVDLKTFGSHTITLTAVDIRGQTTSTSFQFGLIKDPSTLKPVSDFLVNQSSVRTAFFNFNKSFNPDIRFGIKNYHIEFGDGTSADINDDTFATHTYLNSGTYNVTLAVISAQGNGLIKSATTKTITVSDQDVPILNPVAAFAYQLNSWALNVTFENEKSGTPNGSIISYLWDFGDGTTATGAKVAHFYDPGSYLVTLTVTDSAGLKNYQTQHITITQVGSDLVANIDCGISTAQKQTCNVTALDKFNEISSVSVNWGDGTTSDLNEPVEPAQGLYKVSKKFFTTGIQTITLHVTTARGATRTVSTTKEVILSAPIAKINCTTDNLRATCNSGGSFDPTGAGVESFTYNFGVGLPVTTTNAYLVNNYSLGGTYNVTLTVKSKSGLSSSISTQVTTKDTNPIANIGCYTYNMMAYCNGLSSYDQESENLSYEFDYSDGFVESNSTGISSHAYSQPGLYTVNLKVTDTFGNSGLKSMQVQAVLPPNQLPNLGISCYSREPFIEICNAYAQDPDGLIISFKYNWDDNTEETHADNSIVTHIFSTAGQHQVALTVTDNDGGVRTITETFNVQENRPPLAYISCSPITQGVRCYSSSRDPDLNDVITEYKWDLGNGVVITSMTPSVEYTYASSGSYTVSLQVKDKMGATSNASQNVTTIENQAPFARIDCENSGLQTISCHTFSYDSDGSISNIHWALDDGFVFNGNSFTHTFASGEVHSATLTVTDNLGKSSTITGELNVLVNKLPSFEITIDNTNGNLPFIAHFEATKVVDLDGTIASYKWIFADGTFSDQAIVDHTFTVAGVYEVKLQVTDNNGGMTERSVTIRTSAPSNLIINTDKDNGVANLNVHFDANGSSDPEGEIVKYEWIYQGSKFAEGSEADYEFDLAGDQYVELVATNNFGVKTKILKTISILAPPIYLDGITKDIAFVDREYSASFDLVFDPSISVENVTFELQDAPTGAVFDSETKTLTWKPKLEDVGDVLFYLNITDGVLNYRRKFKISVHELISLASFPASVNGGNYTIQAPDSIYNKAQVVLPQNEIAYNVTILQARDGDQEILKIESSTSLKKPIVLNFSKEIEIEQRVNGVDKASIWGAISRTSIYRNTERIWVCYQQEIRAREARESFYELSTDDFGSNNVYILKTMLGTSKLNKLTKALKLLNNKITDANIYLADNTMHLLKSPINNEIDHGLHPLNDKDTFFLNADSLETKSDIVKKFYILHENYHLLQSRESGCIDDLEAKKLTDGWRNISESSADYGVLRTFTPEEVKSVLVDEKYKFLIDTAYTIGSSSLGKGILAYNPVPYSHRLMWDYFDIDPLRFFKNYGNDNSEESNQKVLNVLKKTVSETNHDFTKSLLKYTDEINNFEAHGDSDFVSMIKEAPFLTGWKSEVGKMYNSLGSNLTTSQNGFYIITSLPPLSGTSQYFLIKDLENNLPFINSSDVMSIEVQNDPDLRMDVRTVEVDDNGDIVTAPSEEYYMRFSNFGKLSTSNYSRSLNKGQKVIINVVNTSAIPKEAVIKVQYLNPSLDIQIPGTTRESNSDMFTYSTTTFKGNNLKVTAFDRNDADNSTAFQFTYMTYCATCDYTNRWIPKVENVKSISDFSIPHSTWKSPAYSVKVTAVNKFGKSVSKTFYVNVPQDQKPSVSLVLQECHPTCGYGCEGSISIPYTALLKISDPDNEEGDPNRLFDVIYFNPGQPSMDTYPIKWGGGTTTFQIPACTP